MNRSQAVVPALILLGVQISAVGLLAQEPSPPSCDTCNLSNPNPCGCGKWEAITDAEWASDVPGNPARLLQAIHMVQTHTGWIIAWGGGTQVGSGSYVHYWNPNAPHQDWRFSQTPSGQSMFCGGHVVLPQGQVMSLGGNDVNAQQADQPAGMVQTFLLTPPDPSSSDCTPCPWTAGPNMAKRRWYPTGTVLPDAKILVTSGWELGRGGDPPTDPTSPDPTFGPDIAEIPEIYNPTASVGTWSPLINAVKLDVSLYPAMYVDPSPNGTRLLYVGPGAAPHDPNG